MAQALVLIQRKLRGRLARLRLHRAEMRSQRVVHSKIAIGRLLEKAKKMDEVFEPAGPTTNAITWTQYVEHETEKVFYLRTEHLKFSDYVDTRWEAPDCFKGKFRCGFDDLGDGGVCQETFASEFEVEAHRTAVSVGLVGLVCCVRGGWSVCLVVWVLFVVHEVVGAVWLG